MKFGDQHSARYSISKCIPKITTVLLLPLVLLAGSNAADFRKVEPASRNLLLAGSVPWGSVELWRSRNGIEGVLPWGTTRFQREGSRVFGESPWGHAELTYRHGLLSGEMPWGSANLIVSRTTVNGMLPWGHVHLRLQGQAITGQLPWGPVHLHLAAQFHSLTNSEVLLSVAALLSDKT